MGAKPIAATTEQIATAYAELKSLRKVGKLYGCTGEGIRCKMQELGLIVAPKPHCDLNENFFKEETEKSFYWAGFIAADGCVKKRKQRNNFRYDLSIGLAQIDIHHLEKFKSHIQSEHKIGTRTVDETARGYGVCHKCEISMTSKMLFDDLAFFNVTPKKSMTHEFPQHLRDHLLIHHFLRGYFDGDGSVYMNKGNNVPQLAFNAVGTYDFLENFRQLISANCDIDRDNKVPRKRANIFCLEYSGNILCPKIYNYLYRDATVYLDRKFEKIRPYLSDEVISSMMI
jgi:hypothetical protein